MARILNLLKLNLPFIISFLIIIGTINVTSNINIWKNKTVIQNDVISYYAYLPATFIYHDYKLDFMDNYKGPHHFIIWPREAPNGGKTIITSMGMAFLYAPFFFAADYYAQNSEYDAGGYSEPYQLAIVVCAIFYFIIGLIFLSKLLLHYFNPYISALALVITILGSNLLYYTISEPGMSHLYSFTLITLFIWNTIKWYQVQKPIYAIFIGLLIGIISLIRPTNMIVALFFILYDIKSWKEVVGRVQFFLSKFKHIALITTFCFLVWLPQFLYWKSITGSFLYYSYGPECKFFFNNPQIANGLFSYRNGWLIYSPAMIFSVLGLFFLWKRHKDLQLPLIAIFIVFIYVTYSWFIWWYGGSFGSRPMIDLYGLMALSTGVFFTYINSLKLKWVSIPVVAMAFILSAASLHHMNKRRHLSIHWDSMTKEAFWDHYLQKGYSPTFEGKLRAPDYTKALDGVYEYADESK